MPDARFHTRAGPYRLRDLASRTQLFQVPDGADPAAEVTDVGPLETAGPGELSFLDNRRYLPQLEQTGAGFVVVTPELASRVPEGTVALPTPHPYLAFALISQALYPGETAEAGVHPSAVIDPSAAVADGASIGANAVIGAGAEIGSGTVIGANSTVGRNAVIGADCRIGPNVSVECCEIGDRVTVQPGAMIGMPGFGFAPHPERHQRVPQLGRAIIGNDCHIGANSCIACGSGHDTVLGNNVWIDNQVQVAHNVEIGDGSILVGQVGVAGSAKLGRFVQLGGQSGIAGHVSLGDQVRVGATSGVMGDVAAGETVLGLPAIPAKEFWRQLAALKRLVPGRRPGK